MKVRSLIQDVDNLLTPVIESLGYELIEVEYTNEHGRWLLRLYIDNPNGGIALGDCESVSRSVGAILDVEDPVPGAYNLEVSSPGDQRPIRRLKDFKKYMGSKVMIKTSSKVGDRKNFRGIIKSVEGEKINIESNNEVFEIPLTEIFKARLLEEIGSGGK